MRKTLTPLPEPKILCSSPVGGGGGGGVLPIIANTGSGEAPPERGTFLGLQVYERVADYLNLVSKKAQKD